MGELALPVLCLAVSWPGLLVGGSRFLRVEWDPAKRPRMDGPSTVFWMSQELVLGFILVVTHLEGMWRAEDLGWVSAPSWWWFLLVPLLGWCWERLGTALLEPKPEDWTWARIRGAQRQTLRKLAFEFPRTRAIQRLRLFRYFVACPAYDAALFGVLTYYVGVVAGGWWVGLLVGATFHTLNGGLRGRMLALRLLYYGGGVAFLYSPVGLAGAMLYTQLGRLFGLSGRHDLAEIRRSRARPSQA